MSIGSRVQYVREMVEPSRSVFCDRFGFGYTTVRKWEMDTDSRPLLSPLCDVLFDEGIICDEAWLLTGQGVKPYRVQDSLWGAHLFVLHAKDVESRVIKKRLKLKQDGMIWQLKYLFKAYPQKKLVVGRVRDESMSPLFQTGDFVAGILSASSVDQDKWHFGLWEIEPGRFILRQGRFLKKGWEIKTLEDQNPYQSISKGTPFYSLLWFHRQAPINL